MNKTNIFIPEKCKVGFNTRKDTFTGKLGYVIYYKDKEWKQEKSWEGWREKVGETKSIYKGYNNGKYEYDEIIIDNSVSPIEFDNIPMEGFVLNKKVGGYASGWNHRQAKARVHHPLGFEFEISFENVLYLLEHTNFIVGKGIEGKCILGWEGKNIVLIPENSNDYQEMIKFTFNQSKKAIKLKDLKTGYKYLTKQNETWVYLGKFNTYAGISLNDYKYNSVAVEDKIKDNVHLFYDLSANYYPFIEKKTCNTIIQELEEIDISYYLDKVANDKNYVGVAELVPYEVAKENWDYYKDYNHSYYKKEGMYIRIDKINSNFTHYKHSLSKNQFDKLDKIYKFKLKLNNGNII